jgi:hypothetical protein
MNIIFLIIIGVIFPFLYILGFLLISNFTENVNKIIKYVLIIVHMLLFPIIYWQIFYFYLLLKLLAKIL